MNDEKQHRRFDRKRVFHPQQHHERSESADGREGKEALQVCLNHGDEGTPGHRDRTETHQGEVPERRFTKDRVENRDEKNSRLHHRRGMQVGTHRCRCRHRSG